MAFRLASWDTHLRHRVLLGVCDAGEATLPQRPSRRERAISLSVPTSVIMASRPLPQARQTRAPVPGDQLQRLRHRSYLRGRIPGHRAVKSAGQQLHRLQPIAAVGQCIGDESMAAQIPGGYGGVLVTPQYAAVCEGHDR